MSIKLGEVTIGIAFSALFLAFVILITGGVSIADLDGRFEFHIDCINIPGANRQIGDCISSSSSPTPHATPRGDIQHIWVEHNVYENSQIGMRIHVRFSVGNLQGISCSAGVYFYLASGEALNDYNGRYSTTNGKVATGVDFTPSYENATFSDLSIFMPYSELHLMSGTSNLNFYVRLYDHPTNTFFASSDPRNFTIANG